MSGTIIKETGCKQNISSILEYFMYIILLKWKKSGPGEKSLSVIFRKRNVNPQ